MTDRDYEKEYENYDPSAWDNSYHYDFYNHYVDTSEVREEWIYEILAEIKRLKDRVTELEEALRKAETFWVCPYCGSELTEEHYCPLCEKQIAVMDEAYWYWESVAKPVLEQKEDV